MKLSPIEKVHLLQAADEIDRLKEKIWSDYWVVIPEKDQEYPFKQLVKRAYRFATGRQIDNDFFQSNDNYRKYIERTFSYKILYRIHQNITFFSEADLGYFSAHAGEPYRTDNPQAKVTGEKIRLSIFEKTNAWAKALNLAGFKVEEDNDWQVRGRFASYSWARIYRTADKDKKIFFTVGVDTKDRALVYKLDCYHSSSNKDKILTPKQQAIFRRIVDSTGARWQSIRSNELQEYSWHTLVEMIQDFIEYYIPLYDEVVAAVWATTPPVAAPPASQDCLFEKAVPPGIAELPVRTAGRHASDPDYDRENKWKKDIGNKGEELVKIIECRYLTAQGRPDLAEKVKKMPDFEGYDILSFFPDGRAKYVEVKTTPGRQNRPFFWSWNERAFMVAHPGSYYLYRLYNYDRATNTADFFILDADIEARVLEEPIQYCVHIKQI
jgi:Domain of unknown function (DUF3883)